MMYHWFAQVHGWTPRQVDELGLGELFWLPVMKEASDLAAEQLRDRELGAAPRGRSFLLQRREEMEPRMARVLWHSCAPWACSGYGVQTAIWAQKLVEMGHEVFISSFWGLTGSATQWNGITVLPGFGNAYCSPSLQQHARHVRPDLVITLGDVWVLDPAVLREIPVAHWLPCDCRPMSTADRSVVEAAGPQLIAMSRFGQARFKAAGFRAHYVPHAVDFGVFKPAADKVKLREACDLDPGAFVIGVNAANNDAIRKAPAEMLLAFAKFSQSRPDAVLSLHTGIHQDGGQDLECIAENLGITDKVRVVDQYRYAAGLVGLDDLADWYGCIDVLCAATFGEGFGIPIVEARACGIPVVTTKASAMEELNGDELGFEVDGEPFWNGVHRGWWIRPSISGLVAAFEDAYERRGETDRVKLRESVAQYEVSRVAVEHMGPAVDGLLGIMAAKRGGGGGDLGGGEHRPAEGDPGSGVDSGGAGG